jgi:ABC-type sugar transport system ATPase subunit
MASQIAVINKGRIEQLAPPKTVYKRPANLFVADFIGYPSINLVEGRTGRKEGDWGVFIEKGQVFLKTAYRSLPADCDVVAGIRPENIRIADEKQTNTVSGEVRTILPSGSETVLRVRAGAHTFSVLAAQELELSPGARIDMVLPPENLLVFDQESRKLYPHEA